MITAVEQVKSASTQINTMLSEYKSEHIKPFDLERSNEFTEQCKKLEYTLAYLPHTSRAVDAIRAAKQAPFWSVALDKLAIAARETAKVY